MTFEDIQTRVESSLVFSLQFVGLATTFGFFKRLRHPTIRLGAAAFTASTNLISFRDDQVQVARRRCLLGLLQNRQQRLEAWAKTEEKFRFYDYQWGENYKQNPADFQVWDAFHGEKELTYRLQTLYSSEAIWFKSLLVGVSLGTQPLLSRIYPWAIIKWNEYFYGQIVVPGGGKVVRQPLHCFWAITAPSYSLHSVYGRSSGLAPYITYDNGLKIEMAHQLAYEKTWRRETGLEALQQWRASPDCWYSRAGKLPLLQFCVEEEE